MPIPVSANDVVRVEAKGNFNLRQEIHNVFYYNVITLPTSPDVNTLEWIGAGFWYHLFTPLMDCLNAAIQYTAVEVSLIDKTTFTAVNAETYTVDGAHDTGNVSGESLPAFVTWGFKYIRPSLNFRHGWKRFSGVSESHVVGDFPTGAAVTLLNTLATALNGDIAFADPTVWGDTGSGVLHPLVLRTERGGLDVRPIQYDEPLDVVFNKVGTQNSRKYWIGI